MHLQPHNGPKHRLRTCWATRIQPRRALTQTNVNATDCKVQGSPELTHFNVLVLNRVRAFLPQLLAANEEVQQRARENPSAVDIESFDGTEEAYIQLVRRVLSDACTLMPCEQNLGLGLFERVHAQPSDSREESDDDEESSTESSTDTTASQDDDSDHDSSQDEVSVPDLISLVTGTRPMRPLPRSRRRQHPGIVVLSSSDSMREPSDQPEEMQDEAIR